MKHRILHTAAIYLLFMTAALAASCGRSMEEPEPPEEKTMSLGVQFRVPTRATETDGDGYSEDDYESYVDVENNNYRIYFFDSDNKFIARFNTKITERVKGDGYIAYNVLGILPESVASHSDFKMVMIANWEQGNTVKYDDNSFTPGVTTIENLCTANWAQYAWIGNNALQPNSNPAQRKLMPFYGVHEYTGIQFRPDELTRLEDPLYLLRAMAKVEVTLETTASDNLTFSSIQINRYNERGYCAPKDVFSHDKYNQELDRKDPWTLHLLNDKNDTNDKSFDLRHAGRKEKNGIRTETWKMYLPEYDNTGNDFSSIKAKFNIQLEEEDPFIIHFAKYDENGDPDETNRMNIERNNLYRFRVKCDGYKFKLQLTVSDWAELHDNNFEFGDGQIVSPVKPWDDEIKNDIKF